MKVLMLGRLRLAYLPWQFSDWLRLHERGFMVRCGRGTVNVMVMA